MHPVVDPRQVAVSRRGEPLLGDRACGNATQNSHRRLLEMVGAWPGDTKPHRRRHPGRPHPAPRWRCWSRPEAGDAPVPQPLRVRRRGRATRGASTTWSLTAGGERQARQTARRSTGRWPAFPPAP